MTRAITAADLTVLAPDFYPSPYPTRYLRASAARYSVPIHWYGTGEPYRGWLDVQITRLLSELRRVPTSHFIYTDSSDAILLTDLDEIAATYSMLGMPELLMSVEHDDQLCAGGWMGRVGDAIDALEWLANWTYDNDDGNPQNRWREAAALREVLVERDTPRAIFQVMDESIEVVAAGGERGGSHEPTLLNPDRGSFPCIAHWAGGYTAPDGVGKAALIEPWMERLGYFTPVAAK